MLAKRLTRHGLMLSGGLLSAGLSQKAAASIPAGLVVSTANAATLVAAGQAVVPGVISAGVAALTEGVVKSMFLTKLNIATVVMLTVGMVGTGAVVLTWQATAAGEPSGYAKTDDGQKKDGPQNERKERPADQRRGFDLVKIVEQLELDAEQQEKFEKLMKTTGEKEQQLAEKLGADGEQAKQNEDREKIQQLVKAHEQEMAKLYEDLYKSIAALLTDEQRKKFTELLSGRRPEGFSGPGVRQMLPPPLQEHLGLTPEQREKVAQLQKETEAKLKGILNDEQNRKLDELKKSGPPDRSRQKE
jgi:LTXXQ motif family protein